MSQKKYPEELTFDEFDSIKWDLERQFGLDDDDMTADQIVRQVRVCPKDRWSDLHPGRWRHRVGILQRSAVCEQDWAV